MTLSRAYECSKIERIVLGEQAPDQIAREAKRLNAQNVFLICSQSLDSSSGICASIKQVLGQTFAGAFTGIRGHSPRNGVIEAAKQARTSQADLLVSIGGGSQIDATKVIQLCLDADVSSEEHLVEYASSIHKQPSRAIPELKTPVIAVPTTLSGAEFGTIAGLSDPNTGTKEGYRSPNFAPTTILFDGELATHSPIDLWLSSAIRSLDHAAEGLCSASTFPYLDGCFTVAIRQLSLALPAAKSDPYNTAARMLGFQAVWSVSPGVGQVTNGASHGLGYILGAMGVAHGHTSCVLLPAVLTWNAAVNVDRQEKIANALGAPGVAAGEATKQFIAKLGLPTRLSEVGIHRTQFAQIAEIGSKHPVVLGNPRPIEGPEDIIEILEIAERGGVAS
ncbi:MAG: iron-containing alcohol dehydrogenase [Pseudomonadota bacterium]